jgi:alpha-glucosidase
MSQPSKVWRVPVFHFWPTLNVTAGHFPGMGSIVWRDFFTYKRLSNAVKAPTLEVPLGKIGLHIRSGTAIVLHEGPGHTIASTRRSDLYLLVSLSPGSDGVARGKLYLDDGESQPPTPHREVEILVERSRGGGRLWFIGEGSYVSQTKLQKVVVLVNDYHGEQETGSGVTEVRVRGETWKSWSWDGNLGKLVIERAGIDLNELTLDTISWW